MSVLLLLGCGPGVGLSSAKALALTGHFDHVALVSRNASRLADEAKAVEQAISNASSTDDGSKTTKDLRAQVHTFSADLGDFTALRKTITQVMALGTLRCVMFNAARINPCAALSADVKEMEEDMRTGVFALYVAAQEIVPVMREQFNTTREKPVFLVTNSHLPESPNPGVLVLSVVKAAQQNLITGISDDTGAFVDFAVIKIKGIVGKDAGQIDPEKVAKTIVEVYGNSLSKKHDKILFDIDP